MNQKTRMLNKLNDQIKVSEEHINKINKNIKICKKNMNLNNYNVMIELKSIKRKEKQLIRKMKQMTRELVEQISDCKIIDESTENALSDKPLTIQFIQENYQLSNTFSNVSLNTINASLPIKLSGKALNKIVVECFPSVESRRVTGDIKYNLKRR